MFVMYFGELNFDIIASTPTLEYLLTISDSFTIFGLWVMGFVVLHINGSNCKLLSPEHYFS